MKRIVFFTLAIITASTMLHAQEFGIGARIGPSVSTLITDDEVAQDAFKFIGGGQTDVYAYKMFNKFVGIEGGLMLTQQGYKMDFDADGFGNIKFDTKITYFAVPVSVRFKFGYFTLNSGVRPSFLIKAKREEDDITDEVTTTDVGGFVSPGIQFPIGITLSTTFYLGFVDVIEEYSVANTNFSWQFSVGYTFFRKGN